MIFDYGIVCESETGREDSEEETGAREAGAEETEEESGTGESKVYKRVQNREG